MSEADPLLLLRWRELINVPSATLRAFLARWGRVAGLSRSEATAQGIRSGRDSARAILRMRARSPNAWTTSDWDWARRQVAFVRRMAAGRGALWTASGQPSRRLLSLVLWGHDPDGSARVLARMSPPPQRRRKTV